MMGGIAGIVSTGRTASVVPFFDHDYSPLSSTSLPICGVNLAGLDFSGDNYPNDDYPPTAEECTYYKSKNMQVVRIPFSWAGIQPTLSQPLDATKLALLKLVVERATSIGLDVLLDVHNYGKYKGIAIYADGGPTEADFVDLWVRLAHEFKNNPRVNIDNMNEPAAITAAQMATLSQAMITAVRAEGFTGYIFLEGGGSYASAPAFISSGWSAYTIGFVDPLDKLVFEVHTYFDSDGSGTSAYATDNIAVTRLKDCTAFARANNIKLFLGEFGFANNDGMLLEGRRALDYMLANKDVWVGWTYWAGGPAWGAYMYSIEPTVDGQGNYTDAHPMNLVQQFARAWHD